ncbi:hypothetical protein HanXRQr2_Chr16g0725261 [Helianthus annuus]|uniref:Uncharacterized protein n=1 Tax=Helianthus annuus TaxID=4232 RepID=A0A9K3GX30_HELAN|nr:hypothetical protein HanXRQr2_Chr16g0725261 [Helianthus annuus]
MWVIMGLLMIGMTTHATRILMESICLIKIYFGIIRFVICNLLYYHMAVVFYRGLW